MPPRLVGPVVGERLVAAMMPALIARRRDHHDRPHAACRQPGDGATREDRLVVRVGVEEHDRAHGRAPYRA